MKKGKRFLAALLTFIMALSMMISSAVLVSAEETTDNTTNKTIKLPEGHTYEIFQIFTGDVSAVKNDEGTVTGYKLSNPVWGVSGTGYVADKTTAVAEETINAVMALNTSDATDASIVKGIGDYVNYKKPFISSAKETATVPAGYYLIRDVEGSQTGNDDFETQYVIQVVGENVTLAPKGSKPTVEKEVSDEKSEDNNSYDWSKSADHQIGETFQFRLTASLPTNGDFDDYTTYQVKFTDTMSVGVTFESIDSVMVNKTVVPKTGYVFSGISNALDGDGNSTDETKFELSITDIIPYLGTDNNLAGAEIVVIYNAHLNENAKVNKIGTDSTTNKNTVYLEYSNNPNADGLGKTTEKTVWVFTYELPSVKYAEEAKKGNELKGAKFEIWTSDEKAINLVKEDGYYRVATSNDKDVITEMESSEDGTFNVKGLDVGTYILHETEAPEGYNLAADSKIVITSNHSGDDSSATATVSMTQDGKNATTASIVDKSGTVLPSTGGMGTRLFYVIGAILVLGAGITLIARRRADAK